MNMNPMQTLLAVFYAIMWGSLSNVVHRWRAFETGGALRDCKLVLRFAWSFLLLNLLPIVYLAVVISWPLSRPAWIVTGWGPRTVGQIVVVGLSSLAPFGFYRVWASLVQWKWSWFYSQEGSELPSERPRELRSHDLDPGLAAGNIMSGTVLYLCLFQAPLWLLSYI